MLQCTSQFETGCLPLLCVGYLQEVQKSLNEVIESHPLHDQRATKLGSDNDGNEYIHFPQFCGEDLRIYRQIRHVMVYQVQANKEKASSVSAYQFPSVRLGDDLIRCELYCSVMWRR